MVLHFLERAMSRFESREKDVNVLQKQEEAKLQSSSTSGRHRMGGCSKGTTHKRKKTDTRHFFVFDPVTILLYVVDERPLPILTVPNFQTTDASLR